MPDLFRNTFVRRNLAPVLFVCLLAPALGACGSTPTPSADGRQVDEAAIARELGRRFPGLQNNAAFKIQVSDVADLCRSSAEDFRIHARSVATADLQRQLRRQIAAGCSWRSGELDKLLAEQDGHDRR